MPTRSNPTLPDRMTTSLNPVAISPVEDIVADIRAGRMVILVDEEDRENEGDIVIAADHITPEAINFMARHARGLICLTLSREMCERLQLPPMVARNGAKHSTAFTVSIEAAEGVTTGISAADRARTVQAAVARHAKASDIVQPGHIFPIMAKPGGVLIRAGHTEAGCDLSGIAGLEPAAVICEIMNDDGTMSRLPELVEFSKTHGLKIGAIRDLIEYRARTEKLVEKVSEKTVTTPHGDFRLSAFEDTTSGDVHLAMAYGDINPEVETLVRVHEPVSVLDFLDPASGRHSFPVDAALKRIAEHGHGVIVLLYRPQTGQDLLAQLSGDNANLPAQKWDPRLFGIGAQILAGLNVGRMKILASPRKISSMAGFGLTVVGHVAPDA